MQEREPEEHNQPKIHEHEAPTLDNHSNNDSPDLTLPIFFQDEQTPSTRLRRLAETDLPLRPCFRLHSAILRGGPITETMRAKLRSFLMEESSKQCLLRQTYVLACTLADLYFAHGGTIPVADFQSLLLACLILATKIKEAKLPTISFQTFSREQLMDLEKRVAVRLSYNLAPPTYHNYAERIVFLWDAYTLQEGVYNSRVAYAETGINRPLRRFYEQLDCAFMVLRTLDYDIEDLVVNLFYINSRMINVETPLPSALTQEEFEAVFYPAHDPFRAFFESFLHQYSKNTFLLNPRLGFFLKPFLGVRTAQSEWTINNSQEAVDRMRMWDKFQSIPHGNYQLAKTVMRINPNRAQPSE